MSHSIEEINKHVRVYIVVFVTLAFLTVVTVGVSYLHLPIVPAIILALLIASIKATLVALYFMHLITEKKLIWTVLCVTVVCAIGLFFLPVLTTMGSSRSNF